MTLQGVSNKHCLLSLFSLHLFQYFDLNNDTYHDLLIGATLRSDDPTEMIEKGKICCNSFVNIRQPAIKYAVNSNIYHDLSLIVRKAVFGVSDLVRHKPGCTVTEDC